MKRFDKGYLFYHLLTDLFLAVFFGFAFLDEVFLTNEEGELLGLQGEAILPFFLIVGVAYLLLCGYRALYLYRSGYTLGENEILCRRGAFFNKRSHLEYRRANAINKKQNLLHRLFGIAVLTVDSGATTQAAAAEITVVEKSAIVDALMREVKARQKGESSPSAEEEGKAAEEVLFQEGEGLYAFSKTKKLLYALVNLASAAFYTLIFALLAIVAVSLFVAILSKAGAPSTALATVAVVAVIVLLAIALLTFLTSLLQSFVGYYGFRVRKTGEEIEISYGLFVKSVNTFRLDRIKGVRIQAGLIERLFGLCSIRLEVVGYGFEGSGESGEEAAGIGLLVPLCEKGEVGAILSRLLPAFMPDEPCVRPPSLAPFLCWPQLLLAIFTLLPMGLTVGLMAILGAPSRATLLVFLLFLLAYGFLAVFLAVSRILCYKNGGLAVKDGRITVYGGGFQKSAVVFNKRSFVALEKRATPLQEKAGISSAVLHFYTNAATNEVKSLHLAKKDISLLEEELTV